MTIVDGDIVGLDDHYWRRCRRIGWPLLTEISSDWMTKLLTEISSDWTEFIKSAFLTFIIHCLIVTMFHPTRGVRGGRAEPPTLALLSPTRTPLRGGGSSGVLLILHLPQAIYILLHCIALTQTKRLRKELKYILIHNRALQSFVWSSIALKIHISHFENWIFLFEISLQKVLAHFLLQKRWRNEGFNGTSDISRLWLNSYVYCDTLYNLVSV